MVKVLHYGMTTNIGGVETFIMAMYRAMDKTKVQFDFVVGHDCPKIPFEDEIENMGGHIYRVCYGLKENPIKAYRALYRFFSEHNGEYAAVHLNSCFMGNSLLLKMAHRFNVPIRIFHSHNAGDMFPSKSVVKKYVISYERKWVFRYATHLFACSGLAGKFMFGNKPFSFIPNAISIDDFKFNENIRQGKRKELGIEGKLVIGFVGRLQYQKNPIFLLDIFQEVLKKEPDSVLIIVGGGPMRDDVCRKINTAGLSEKVMMLGVRTDVSELYQAFDCFLLPSLFEGLPVVLVETQTSGLPCIVSDAITEEISVSPNILYLSLSEKPSVWAEQILCFVKQPHDRNIGADNVKKAGFDSISMAERMSDFYMTGENSWGKYCG